MAKIDWQQYLEWRERKGLNNADVAIFAGMDCEIKSPPVIINQESVVQVQIGNKANILVPMEMVTEE